MRRTAGRMHKRKKAANQQKEKEKSREGQIAGVIKKFEQRVAWWNKTFQFGPGKPKTSDSGAFQDGLLRERIRSGSSTLQAAPLLQERLQRQQQLQQLQHRQQREKERRPGRGSKM